MPELDSINGWLPLNDKAFDIYKGHHLTSKGYRRCEEEGYALKLVLSQLLLKGISGCKWKFLTMFMAAVIVSKDSAS